MAEPSPGALDWTAHQVLLAGEADFAGFRAAARGLLRDGVVPDDISWEVAGGADSTVDADADADADAVADSAPAAPAAPTAAHATPATAPSSALRIPAELIALGADVVQHASGDRFHRLYRLLWRLQREPALRHDTLDPELAHLRRMAQAVRREQHKMKAFVRFREVREPEADPQTPSLHVAWFEPTHHVVEAVAPFFMRRFAGMRFAILTPERSVHWDGLALVLGPGAGREQAPPADAGEALWLTYYASIFNPARLKLRAMEKEMPRRYWSNLPEAALISGLAAEAHERSAKMIEREAVATRRRLPADRPPR